MFFADYFTFSEWYHYLLLFLWLIMLGIGVKYFHLLESHFVPKSNFTKGVNYGRNVIAASFAIGLTMFVIWMFKPAHVDPQSSINWLYVEYGFYILFIFVLFINAVVSLKKYKSASGITRLIILTILMLLYFYSGMLGGLLVIATLALFVVVFALIKLKNTLTIR